MFANTFQSGFISIFYSVGSNPLHIWDKQVKNGHIRRVVDDEVRSLVLEISGTNVATTYITCPIKPRASLGIKLPFLVMIIKNMKKYFTFEIQILDDKNMHRRFRVSNFQSATKVRPFCTTMPIGLSAGWNQVQFNLADFTKRAYGSTYLETTRVQIHANVRIRRLYFSDQLYCDEDMPNEYKLFLPTPGTKGGKGKKKEEEQAPQEKKTSKRLTAEDLKIELPEEGEIPSGAMPTPAGAPTPAADGQPEDSSMVAQAEEKSEPAPSDAGDQLAPSEAGPSEIAETVTTEGAEGPESPGGEMEAAAEAVPADAGEQVVEVTEPAAVASEAPEAPEAEAPLPEAPAPDEAPAPEPEAAPAAEEAPAEAVAAE